MLVVKFFKQTKFVYTPAYIPQEFTFKFSSFIVIIHSIIDKDFDVPGRGLASQQNFIVSYWEEVPLSSWELLSDTIKLSKC